MSNQKSLQKVRFVRAFKSKFENPDHKPLNEVYITDTSSESNRKVPALNKLWVDLVKYPKYESIPLDTSAENIILWKQSASAYLAALNFFESLPYHIFWSHVCCLPDFSEFVDSFLINGIPIYMEQPDGELESLYSDIYHKLFGLIERIFKVKESETEYMLPETLGALIKAKSVITIDMLWNFVRLYAYYDRKLLTTILETAFDIIPSIQDELRIFLIGLHEIFETIGTYAYESEDSNAEYVLGLTNLLFDAAYSIHMFLELYQSFKNICIEEDFFSKIVHVYDDEIPLLLEHVNTIVFDDIEEVNTNIQNSRVELLKVCHVLLACCVDMALQNQNNEDEQLVWVNRFLNLVAPQLKTKYFILDYNNAFPLRDQLDLLSTICPKVDKTIVQNILKGLPEASESESSDSDFGEDELTAIAASLENINVKDEDLPEDVLMDSKISAILDVIPDLGDGFVEQCLLRYNMETQDVLAAILENNLPDDLANLDRTLARIPPELSEPGPSWARAHIGKKPDKFVDMNELLNDKSHIQEQKKRFENYSVVSALETNNDLYDDDYDDTLDERPLTIFEGFNDPMEVLPKYNPNHANRLKKLEKEEESEEEVDLNAAGPSTASSHSANAFCEDPSVIRARKEAKYQQNQSNRKDVVGKPKGQGQEKDVQVNRDRKNKNKSAGANHNRRSGAQWKRNRGMIPS